MTRSPVTAAADAIPANEQLKRGSTSILWASMIGAVMLHLAAFAFWPEMTADVMQLDDRVLTAYDIPDEILLPVAPDELIRPATPIMATEPVPDDVTIGLTTHEANPPSVLTPPAPETRTSDTRGLPFFPFTVRPEILNAAEVLREMQRVYPPTLRDAGIGGRVELALYIDEEGRVVEARVTAGSGHGSLDAAALELSNAFRFSPALNRDKKVAVWVAFPVVFQVRNEPSPAG